jgi:glutathione synthase/RimK-type ligase-like ATP-grasp enzyme
MKPTLGILKGFRGGAESYELYIKACEELVVPYKVVDVISENWVDNILASGCAAFLVRPTPFYSTWKQMYDERLYHIVHSIGMIIYPRYHDLLMYENKRHMAYTLRIANIPTPSTHIFYNLQEAVGFIDQSPFPLVFKTHIGAQGRGVKILRSRADAKRLAWQIFTIGFVRNARTNLKGLLGKRSISLPYYFSEPEYKVALLQEYLPNAFEWRMIRIGNSYFGHQKLKKGDFHSGSSLVGWCDPPERLLRFTKYVCDTLGTDSMCVDIFETQDGTYLVNELQTVFGSYDPSQMYINGTPGRYLYVPNEDSWVFEEGYFNQNGCCNLRILHLLDLLGVNKNVEVAQ